MINTKNPGQMGDENCLQGKYNARQPEGFPFCGFYFLLFSILRVLDTIQYKIAKLLKRIQTKIL